MKLINNAKQEIIVPELACAFGGSDAGCEEQDVGCWFGAIDTCGSDGIDTSSCNIFAIDCESV